MLVLDSEALSAIAHGPAVRRDRVRALIAQMRRRGLPIATAAAVPLDDEAVRALNALEAAGMNRSDGLRSSIDASRVRHEPDR